MISLTLPATTLAILDEIATHLGSSRGGAIAVLVGLGVEAGYAPSAARHEEGRSGCPSSLCTPAHSRRPKMKVLHVRSTVKR